jgi:signal transduction histidine kinase
VVVDKHNGMLSVDSEVGRGTTFTIQIPVVGTSTLADLAPGTGAAA